MEARGKSAVFPHNSAVAAHLLIFACGQIPVTPSPMDFTSKHTIGGTKDWN
jgi:hypothetical protein